MPTHADEPPWVLEPGSSRDLDLLRYDVEHRCWLYETYETVEDTADIHDQNPDIPADGLGAAQQWVARAVSRDAHTGILYIDEPTTWTITEWRLIRCGSRIGWMPLYDITDLRTLAFPARDPRTGSRTNPAVDNGCRVFRDRGRSSIHPLHTELQRGTTDDITEIAYTVAAVVGKLPHAIWLVPEPEARMPVLTAYLKIHVEHAIISGHGHVDVLREYPLDLLQRTHMKVITAAAVWLYHGPDHPPIPHYADRLRKACHRFADRFIHLDHMLTRYRPAVAHHHLAALAVADHRRRQHLGSLLIRTHLTVIGTSPITATTDAPTRSVRAFYRTHGFTFRDGTSYTIGTGPRSFPGATMWPGHRQPATAPAVHPTATPAAEAAPQDRPDEAARRRRGRRPTESRQARGPEATHGR